MCFIAFSVPYRVPVKMEIWIRMLEQMSRKQHFDVHRDPRRS